jgi:uncharacterized protein YigE (DUF2233 family)
MTQKSTSVVTVALLASLVGPLGQTLLTTLPALAISPVPIMPSGVRPAALPYGHNRSSAPISNMKRVHHNCPGGVTIKAGKKAVRGKEKKKKAAVVPPPPPQALVDNMSSETLTAGVVHKVHRGAMYINLLDVDLASSNVFVKPVLAGETFSKLDEVRDQAQKVNAIAAVNGNYFKHDGTPLGTLVIDGEWIAGPLYDRTCMGITDDGRVLVDRVKLHGMLETSNPDVKGIWINNVNQPRRHGCRIVAYTRRWGENVNMAYDGTVVAINSHGRVVGKSLKTMGIPAGGFVLTDSKTSPLTHLNVGDLVHLSWHPGPHDWNRVVHAISGGPVLIRNGQLFVDCQSENFRKSWTSNSIKARTAVGVTANRHLLLATIEGPHTLWDVAKFLKKLGAVDAINLDGGGSTTMVIGGNTVTRNQSHFQRRVASSLVVLPKGAQVSSGSAALYRGSAPDYVPVTNITDFDAPAAPPSITGQPAAALPSTERTFELVEPPPASAIADENSEPENVAGSESTFMPTATAPARKTGGRFGWVHKLNPLDW